MTAAIVRELQDAFCHATLLSYITVLVRECNEITGVKTDTVVSQSVGLEPTLQDGI